ncbi:MAG: hypothetical protein A2Y25_10645 [Candidatus Melainabacteria bacterium GWF2_37_15]|nr:MAG: hypothetical protein A2Y25_10645 [Candidatus Melainabacteria bacterium GWF2_37_15]
MKIFKLAVSSIAKKQLESLEKDKGLEKRLKAVRRTLGILQRNPRHPSLKTHEYSGLTRKYGCKVYEAYAENKTPAAYRIFWHYGPEENTISIIEITPHP